MEKETPVKLVIVGGVAGGAATAARARRLSEEAQIIMFERGADVSFANCGMPYFVGGTIENRDQLTVVSAAQLKNWFNIDVRTLSDVRNIDLTAKKVTVFDFATQREYEEPFTHLVISTGAAPKRPCVPGHDLPHCHVLRNLSDMDKIMGEVNRIAASQDPKTKRAVVVGAGFVGLELADNLMQRGIPTTVVEMLNQVFPPVDKEIAKRVEREVRNSGVQLLLGETVEAVEKTSSDGNILVKLNKAQEPIPCGLVIFSVGVVPESSLAKNAGLEIGPRGGIVVDEFMRCKTADAIYTNVYAVGDVVQTKDFVTKNPTQVPLAGPANRQARIAANNVFGRPCTYRGTQSTAIVRVFNATCGITGCSEMALKRQNIPYETAFIYPLHHAEYFPGATFMLIKICFDPATGKLLGAQVVGEEGVDKRCDSIVRSCWSPHAEWTSSPLLFKQASPWKIYATSNWPMLPSLGRPKILQTMSDSLRPAFATGIRSSSKWKSSLRSIQKRTRSALLSLTCGRSGNESRQEVSQEPSILPWMSLGNATPSFPRTVRLLCTAAKDNARTLHTDSWLRMAMML
eukprot:TRINITY_DN688_c0_g1_i16.p1 TRINITY_DN688_c0_g1~~TRINITY_DN688_c0_g1_i16.p1  ORF type:complete len:572 (-),score=71.99 TRINITY_DN688_c0_g1_i16:138-1853(-)